MKTLRFSCLLVLVCLVYLFPNHAALDDVTAPSNPVKLHLIIEDVSKTANTQISEIANSLAINQALPKEVTQFNQTKSPGLKKTYPVQSKKTDNNNAKTNTNYNETLLTDTNSTIVSELEVKTEPPEVELVTSDDNQDLDTTEVYNETKYYPDLSERELEYLSFNETNIPEELESTDDLDSDDQEFHIGETSSDYDFVISSSQTDYMVEGRIVGGSPAALANFPFAVHVSGMASPGGPRACTGALISTRYVLLPASCVQETSSISVRVGALRISGAADTGTVLTFATPIIHPKYKLFPKDYNIALLRLRSPATLSANVVPIDLASKSYTDDSKYITGWTMIVIGFGTTSATATDQQLRSVNLTVFDKSECYRQMKPITSIMYTSKQSCLSTESGVIGLCGQDDIGALVVSRFGSEATFNLVGIVTYIHGCMSSIPVLFTRVGPHYDWIRKYLFSTNNNIRF